MKRIQTYLASLLLILTSCTADFDRQNPQRPVEVGFYAGRASGICLETRSLAGEDGLSTFWQAGDALGLWAFSDNGACVLNGNVFSTYGLDAANAFFTSVLPEPMPEGKFRYIAAYPVPEAVSGNTLYFRVPDNQDGRSGAGEDIMISDPVVHGPLATIDWSLIDDDELHLSMNHILHRLRFYTESPELKGEKIKKMILSFPKAIAGRISLNIQRPDDGVDIIEGASSLEINLKEPVELSGPDSRHYMTASIIPTTFGAGESMSAVLYTDSKIAKVTIPLMSRTFAAGHSTPVNIAPRSVSDYYRLALHLLTNNLGEDISTVTVTAPEGSWINDAKENSVILRYGRDISIGGNYELGFADRDAFLSLSGKTLRITYESEHVIIYEDLVVPSLSDRTAADLSLNVPYLLFEDFSTVPSFSSNDEFAMSSAGSKNAHSFLNGWTGGRIGALAGESIRLACRRETSVDYDARVDSAPLNGKLKSAASLKVEFDYGADEHHEGILPKAVGQNCYIGYVTSTQAYKSGDTSGYFDRENNSFYIMEDTGSYTNTPNHAEYVINVPATSPTLRLSIRTEVEHMAGMNNNTTWLYIDNIKVKIADK